MYVSQRQPIDWDKIGSQLKDKGALLPCPRCGKSKFTFAGETDVLIPPPQQPRGFRSLLPRSIADFDVPSSIPAIIITCDNCGYLMQHAIGILLEDKK